MASERTVGELLDDAETRIRKSPNVDLWRAWVARVDAEELMAATLGREVDGDGLDERVDRAAQARFEKMLARRVAGEPIVLIRGHMEFAGLKLVVRPGVFTPRSSSELLAAEALRRLRPRRRPVAVDVACGAGAVALAVASKLPRARVVGLDISAEAVALGRHNARLLGLRNVTFAAGDLLAPLRARDQGGVDVFTIHPPYVARRLVKTLSREIRDYEPAHSLTDRSIDGLGLVRRLAREGQDWLRPGGWVLVEVSSDLVRGVRGVMLAAGYVEVKSHRDSVGATRVVAARFPG
jgi:release factor glutamine methyltransferase